MKTLSPEATALLASAQRPDEAVHALSALADLAQPALVPHVAPFAFDGSLAVRRAAAAALERALAAGTPAELLQIDEACRRSPWAVPAAARAWHQLSPRRLSSFEALGPGGRAVLLVTSFHPNGHVREAAVVGMDAWTAAVPDGREIEALLVRVNDWVPAVARRALAAVDRRVVPVYAWAWLRALPLLLRLGPGTRRAAGPLVDRVLALLRAPEQRGTLVEALRSGPRTMRRDAIRLLRKADGTAEELAQIVGIGLDDADPVVRLGAVELACGRLGDAEFEAVLRRALEDPHPPVRQRALAAVAEGRGAAATPWLERALLDRGATIRELARFALRRLGWPTPFAAFYRGALSSERRARTLAAAVRGLGETGQPTDVEALLPLLDHPRPTVRVAVVRALAALDTPGTVDARYARLADPSRRMTRAVRETLRSQVAAIGADALRGAVGDLPHSNGRLDALALAAELSKWESLLLLLEATASTDLAVGATAGRLIVRWLERQNQSFVAPKSSQLDALRRALVLYGGNLEPPVREALEQIFGYWGRH